MPEAAPDGPFSASAETPAGGEGCWGAAASLRGKAGWPRSRPSVEEEEEAKEEEERKEQEGSGEVVPCTPSREPEP